MSTQPKPESWQEIIIRRGEGVKRLLGLYIGDGKRPLLREGRKLSGSDLERIRDVIIERSHAAQPQPSKTSPEENPKRWETDIDGYPISSQHENGGWMNEEQKASTESDAKTSPVGERSEPSVTDKVWSKIVTETGDMERADRVTSGKDTPSTFELLRPDQPPAKATDDKLEEWTPEFLHNLALTSDNAVDAVINAHKADLAAERQRNFDAEKELRDKARARIEELKQQLLSALAAIEHVRKREGCIVTHERLAQIIDDVDLSVLREHDDEVREKQRQDDWDELAKLENKIKPLVALLLESRRLLNKWAARYAGVKHARKDQHDSRAAVTAIDALAKMNP